MRSYIQSFAAQMEDLLSLHDEEKGESWREMPYAWLHDALKEEMKELQRAFENLDREEVQNECVDIANFAMFIYTRIEEGKRNGNS